MHIWCKPARRWPVPIVMQQSRCISACSFCQGCAASKCSGSTKELTEAVRAEQMLPEVDWACTACRAQSSCRSSQHSLDSRQGAFARNSVTLVSWLAEKVHHCFVLHVPVTRYTVCQCSRRLHHISYGSISPWSSVAYQSFSSISCTVACPWHLLCIPQ